MQLTNSAIDFNKTKRNFFSWQQDLMDTLYFFQSAAAPTHSNFEVRTLCAYRIVYRDNLSAIRKTYCESDISNPSSLIDKSKLF